MTSDDELLKRLDRGAWPQAANMQEAAARIRELEAERDEAVTQMIEAKMANKGVADGTHVIVSVEDLVSIDRRLNQMMEAAYTVNLEGTKEWDIVAGGADIHGMSDKLRAMIRAAQPDKQQQGE